MKKKTAFTLIELIAVLVILAIIALIVTPLVMNVVKKTKVNADKRSVDGYGKAVELALAQSRLDGKQIKTYRYHSTRDTNGKVIYDYDKNEIYNVDYKGNDVYCDVIDKNEDGSIYLKDCYVNGKEVEYTYGDQQINMLMSITKENADKSIGDRTETFLSTNITSSKIKSLEFVNSIDIPAGYSSSDCSQAQDKSVMCWWTTDETDSGYYNMYVGADGIIYAPKDSTRLFSNVGYDKMISFDTGLYFDTSLVKNMSYMFVNFGYEMLNTLNLGLGFNTSNVINMSHMFDQTGMESLLNFNIGENFDTSKVVDMQWMFVNFGYGSLKKLDLGENFDTSNVENMDAMFLQAGMHSLEVIDLGNKFDTSKVKNMPKMFQNFGDYKLKKLDLGDKFDTSNVENMSSMFEYMGECSLNSINLGEKFNTSKVKNMSRMFYAMGGSQSATITVLDLGDKFDTSSVENMEDMFSRTGYYSLETINLGNFGVNRSNVINYSNVFIAIGESNLYKVIVANEDVKNWLKGMDTSDVPDYFKSKIQIKI